MSGRRLAVGACVVLVAVAVAAIGRWETHRFERREAAGILRVWRASSGRQPRAYRIAAPLDCLLYPRAGYPYALESCFDWQGRLVLAVDRTISGDSTMWSLSFAPADAPLRVPPGRLLAIFHRLGALTSSTSTTYLPSPHDDQGPVYVPPHS